METGDETVPVWTRLEPSSGAPPPGTNIGSWVVRECIGTGGSSVVVEAERTSDGFTQRVALKLLLHGRSDEGFLRQLRRERQILAGLVHPHIVRILDGGATESGAPWYAMERIDEGVPLTEWARGRPLAERLEVLIAICRAVDHAHQRLVVHCDLKPANVLVDPDGAPHVLDFGISRWLDEDETGTHRQLTPRWAAPEQLDGEPVTVATDVYALGLLCAAVLTGVAPRQGLTGPALVGASMRPLPPPSSLEPRCAGDLDAIVARATDPEPSARYHGARALADDLRRHLDGDAVHARSGLRWYRASRWVARHRALSLALVALVLLGVGWAATATVQARSLAAQRDLAQEEARRAEQEAERAEETLELLVGLLQAADPGVAQGEELTVREVLGTSIRELDARSSEPRLAGQVRLALGQVFEAVGDRPAARDVLEQARDQLASVFPEDHPLVLRAEMELAFAEANLHELDEVWVARLEEVVHRLTDPEDHARGLQLAADLRAVRGDYEAAAELASSAMSAHRDLGDDRGAARGKALLGFIEAERGEGTQTLVDALAETEAALGTRVHPAVTDILHELARLTEGEPGLRYAEQNLAIRRELYGDGWLVAATLNNYGRSLEEVDPERAEVVLGEAAAMALEALGPDHGGVQHIQVNHGAVLVEAPSRRSEGIALLRSVAERDSASVDLRSRALRLVAGAQAVDDLMAARRTLAAAVALEPGPEERRRLEEAAEALSTRR